MPEFDYDNALSYTNRLIARGASVDAPGLEAGEHKDEIGSLTHWLKNDDDGGQSHRVDLYVNHPQMVNRFLSLYVKDTKEALAEFKTVTGVDLASIKMLPTKAPINKDDDKGGIITALPRPLMAVWKLNPKFDETQPLGGGHSRRLFVRWESVGIPTHVSAPPAPQNAATPPPATVTPKTPQNAGNGPLDVYDGEVPAHDIYDGKPQWFRTPVRDCYGAVKTYILKEVYGNNTFAMNGSLDKRGVTVKGVFDAKGEWAGKPAGELIYHLEHRHDEDEAA